MKTNFYNCKLLNKYSFENCNVSKSKLKLVGSFQLIKKYIITIVILKIVLYEYEIDLIFNLVFIILGQFF